MYLSPCIIINLMDAISFQNHMTVFHSNNSREIEGINILQHMLLEIAPISHQLNIFYNVLLLCLLNCQ